MEKQLFVPHYLYSARTNEDYLPVFEAAYYQHNDSWGDDIIFNEDLHFMANRIGYVFFEHLRENMKTLKIRERYPHPIKKMGEAAYEWHFVPSILGDNPIVYGFGAGTDISFETSFANEYDCDVHVFDPTPQAAEYVAGLLMDNPHIKLHTTGLFNIDGTAKFFKPPQANLGSLSALNLNAGSVFMEAKVNRLKTIMRGLGHDHVDLLKMDIEGAEHRAIEDILFSEIDVRQIALEFDQPIPPWTIEKTMAKLFLAGYTLLDCWGLNCLFVRTDLLQN